ncbi:MAG: iron(III) transport system ATP-binding protein [Actinomycetota bacterium]|nr:iron(III) transport system ATP-binding protein [Actinomycetota bacterium]
MTAKGPQLLTGTEVELSGVTKSFGDVRALDGADLSVAPGTLVAVLGPSGCGKTTLLRAVAGFERIDDGTISVGGHCVAGPGVHVPPEGRQVGIVPQDQALFPHLTVARNVGFGLDRKPGRAERVEAMLDLAGLPGLGDRMPHELSGGQQQRVALARALAPSPSVVLLDEPFANLDAALRVSIRTEVREILRASGATALFVTHDQEEALSTADVVAVMHAGRVIQAGIPEEIYRRPADPWVAGFVGNANMLRGEAAGPGKASCALGVLEYRGSGRGGGAAGPLRLVVRPEQLRLVPSAVGDAVIDDHQYFGHDALAKVTLHDGTTLVVRASTGSLPPDGARVFVTCDGEVMAFGA